jgi:hypothetical protein
MNIVILLFVYPKVYSISMGNGNILVKKRAEFGVVRAILLTPADMSKIRYQFTPSKSALFKIN